MNTETGTVWKINKNDGTKVEIASGGLQGDFRRKTLSRMRWVENHGLSSYLLVIILVIHKHCVFGPQTEKSAANCR